MNHKIINIISKFVICIVILLVFGVESFHIRSHNHNEDKCAVCIFLNTISNFESNDSNNNYNPKFYSSVLISITKENLFSLIRVKSTPDRAPPTL